MVVPPPQYPSMPVPPSSARMAMPAYAPQLMTTRAIWQPGGTSSRIAIAVDILDIGMPKRLAPHR